MLGLDDVYGLLDRKTGATVEWSFGPGHRVYKVGGKVFAIVSEEAHPRLTLKCDPLLSEELRGQYASITPGYHTDKRHWISIRQGADLPDDMIAKLMGHSYDLVVAQLTRKARALLGSAD